MEKRNHREKFDRVVGQLASIVGRYFREERVNVVQGYLALVSLQEDFKYTLDEKAKAALKREDPDQPEAEVAFRLHVTEFFARTNLGAHPQLARRLLIEFANDIGRAERLSEPPARCEHADTTRWH